MRTGLVSLIVIGLFFSGAPSWPQTAAERSFLVCLYPREGKPQSWHRSRRDDIQKVLSEAVSDIVSETPYTGVRVRILTGPDDTVETLSAGVAGIVECDPYLFAATRQRPGETTSDYRIFLQSVVPGALFGEIRVLDAGPVESVQDLRDRWIAVITERDGCATVSVSALAENALLPEKDYVLARSGYIENSFLCLRAGVVDAVAVASDLALEFHEQHPDFPATRPLLRTGAFLPPLFVVRSGDIASQPVLVSRITEALRRYYGPESLVRSDETLYSSLFQAVEAGETP